MLEAATVLHELVKNRVAHSENDASFGAALASAVEDAAALLLPGGCRQAATACNNGLVALHQLRGLLALEDGHGGRAFADSPNRQASM